jgi:hypothetical protein
MNTEKENLSPQQSLDVITAMINQSQGKMRNNSFYFLIWGWTVALANFGMYGLMKLSDYPHPYIVWLITIPAWVVTMIYGSRQDKQAAVNTHLDKINMWLWICYGITLLPIVIFMSKINYNLNPIILTVTAVPTFITGIMLRFRPLLFGGINFWIFGILCFFVDYQTQYLMGGVAIFLGYLVPGYLLKNTRENK